MNIINSILLSASLLLIGDCLTVVHADGVVSNITSQSTNLVFTVNGRTSMTLVATPNLIAGTYKPNQMMAGGMINTRSGTVAYRWTQGTGKVTQANNLSKRITIVGRGSTDNKVNLVLESTPKGKINGGDGWIEPSKVSSHLALRVQNASSAVISPDVYVLSVDAVVWGF